MYNDGSFEKYNYESANEQRWEDKNSRQADDAISEVRWQRSHSEVLCLVSAVCKR